MKLKFLAVIALSLALALPGVAQTTTPDFNLLVPTINQLNWGITLNSTLDALDSVLSGQTAGPWSLKLTAPFVMKYNSTNLFTVDLSGNAAVAGSFHANSLTLSNPCAISSGCTGASSASAARIALGTFTYPGATGIPYGLSNSASRAANASDITALLTYTPENLAHKGVANGYAPLDGTGRIPSSYLPSAVTVGLFVNGVQIVGSLGTTTVNGS